MSGRATPEPTPRHIAVIMDGNGRWAKRRDLPRIRGHEEGSKSAAAVVEACAEAGVKYLTLYAFSSENWKRPKAEVSALMELLRRFLQEKREEMREKGVRLRAIGRLDDLPTGCRKELDRTIGATAGGERLTLILALSYGGRQEIVDAARQLARDVAAGKLAADAIDPETFARNLYTHEFPDPDLLIRTSGELRLSNFLLWQLSYTEIYVTETLWPDFRGPELKAALEAYRQRQRRFGAL